jgi:NRPS condensation-like uncharacterized protein
VEHRVEAGDLRRAVLEVMDTRREPRRQRPWRVTQIRAADGCALVVSVLHMMTDAAGALTVARELGRQLSAGEGAGRGRVDGGDTRHGSGPPMNRSLTQLVGAVPPARWPRLALEAAANLLVPLRLLGLARPPGAWHPADGDAGRPTFETLRMDMAASSPLRARCAEAGCTINDALVAMLAMVNRELFGPGSVGNAFTINLRPQLGDRGPRVCNLSGIDLVILDGEQVGGFVDTARAVARRTERLKAGFVGLAPVLANHAAMLALPHGMVRTAIRWWLRWAYALLDRGLVVTNIGGLEPYLEPFGDRATGGSFCGPFLTGLRVPVITASGFRGRLTVHVNGYDGPSALQVAQVRSALARVVGTMADED